MSLPKIPLLILDTETTGFVPGVHSVIEYACTVIKDGKIESEFEQLLALPEGKQIPPHVQELTHIQDKDLAGQPKFADILPKLQAMLVPGTVIVGQNIMFDLRMLRGEGWDLMDMPWIDTSMLASIVFPELESYSLAYMSTTLGLTHTPRHRALGDVSATLSLLEKCMERMAELPKIDLETMQKFAMRGPEGYKRFFLSVQGAGKSRPTWIAEVKSEKFSLDVDPIAITPPEKEHIQLTTEPLAAEFLPRVLAGTKGPTWIAVKNIEAAARRLTLPKGMEFLYPPELIVSSAARETFLKQEVFTADELTLAIKLYLYSPRVRSDIPVHGEEYAVWLGKLAESCGSSAYTEDLHAAMASPRVISHQHLLSLADDPDTTFPDDLSVIIDDASMLEDTATNAFAWTCHIPSLRAASAGSELLTQCTDLVELWAEKIRMDLDLRYLAMSDLESKTSSDLRGMLSAILAEKLSVSVRTSLEHLKLILDKENLAGRFAWIETYQDGSKVIKSVPENVGQYLRDRLYKKVRTTLLIPPQSAHALRPVLPDDMPVQEGALVPAFRPTIRLSLPIGFSLESLLKRPEAKTILLLSSKRAIEDVFVKYGSVLEEQGVTLICQGFAGGQGRMQAEFAVAASPAVLVQTPWTFEGMDLPLGSVDQLILQALPFDHPSHPVVSRRAARFLSPFNDYSLPRLKNRLFRLLRTFLRHSNVGAEVMVLDDRLRTKEYGKGVAEYLKALVPDEGPKRDGRTQLSLL